MADEQAPQEDSAGILARVRELLGGSSPDTPAETPVETPETPSEPSAPSDTPTTQNAAETPAEGDSLPDPATAEQLMGVLKAMGLDDAQIKQALDAQAAKQEAAEQRDAPPVAPDVLDQIKDLPATQTEASTPEPEPATIGAGSMSAPATSEATTPGMVWRQEIEKRSYV